MVDQQPGDYGSRLDRLFDLGGRPASTRAIAKSLGLSRSTVARMRQGTPSPKGEAALAAAERREARRPSWVDTGPDRGSVSKMIPTSGQLPGQRDIRGQLELVAIWKNGRIDRAATGRAFGVSARTIGRWLNGEARPTMAHQEELRREVRSTALTQSEAAMNQAFTGLRATVAARVRVSGDTRARHISRRYSPEATRAAQTAWLNGGEAGLTEWLAQDLTDNYFGGVDDVNVLDIDQTSI